MKQKFLKAGASLIMIMLVGIFSPIRSHGQAALLVLIFGDKIATEKFHLSIEGGLNMSNLPGLAQGSPIFGANFGLGTYIKLSDKWSLTPEFKPLSQQGASNVVSLSPDATLQNPTTNLVTNYIDVPLLVQYNISSKVSVSAGPQISFLTKADQVTTGSLVTGQNVVVTQDVKSLMHKENFSVPIQFAYALSSQRGGKGIDIKLRYNIGIMEAFTTSTVESKNSVLQFILGFPFINVPKESK